MRESAYKPIETLQVGTGLTSRVKCGVPTNREMKIHF